MRIVITFTGCATKTNPKLYCYMSYDGMAYNHKHKYYVMGNKIVKDNFNEYYKEIIEQYQRNN